jgi:hypothetical protein
MSYQETLLAHALWGVLAGERRGTSGEQGDISLSVMWFFWCSAYLHPRCRPLRNSGTNTHAQKDSKLHNKVCLKKRCTTDELSRPDSGHQRIPHLPGRA